MTRAREEKNSCTLFLRIKDSEKFQLHYILSLSDTLPNDCELGNMFTYTLHSCTLHAVFPRDICLINTQGKRFNLQYGTLPLTLARARNVLYCLSLRRYRQVNGLLYDS